MGIIVYNNKLQQPPIGSHLNTGNQPQSSDMEESGQVFIGCSKSNLCINYLVAAITSE